VVNVKFKEFERFCTDNFIEEDWAEHLWDFMAEEDATLSMADGVLTIRIVLHN
jgi:hypothetical protein